jgi:HPt (histidine-containing phosphotransfer) domain-containing protein
MVRDKYQGDEDEEDRRLIKDEPLIDPQLAELFTRDAEKALAAMEAIHENNYRRTGDVQKYIVNAHAIKSALLNIGEMELSANAFKLEEAGKEQNTAILSKDTPVFLAALRAVIEKVRPTQNIKEPFSRYGNYN